MTYENAIENLKYLISDDCTDHADDFAEEIEMAIEALKKQTPKEPKGGKEDNLSVSYCPVCEAEVGWSGRLAHGVSAYCPNCGQAIDWEGV